MNKKRRKYEIELLFILLIYLKSLKEKATNSLTIVLSSLCAIQIC